MEQNKRTYSRDSQPRSNNSPIYRSRSGSDEIIISKVVLSNTPPTVKRVKIDHDKSNTSDNVQRSGRFQQQLLTPQTPTSTKTYSLDRQYRSLEHGQMLNDTVVEFYLNHLLSKQEELMRERFHIFSTFFYAKIKKLQRSNGNDLDQSIMRWDRHVKLFDKDYLILPICEYKHWLLVIICFAHKQPAEDEPYVIEDRPTRALKPTILVFDSLGCRYLPRFTEPIRNFLNLRWQYERPDSERRNFKDRRTFTEIFCKVPRQRNAFDCGVFLLHYVEKFMTKPMVTYQLLRDGRDLTCHWAMDPRLKREYIKSLIPGQSSKNSDQTSVKNRETSA